MNIQKLTLIFCLFFSSQLAFAIPSEAEFALLPPLCKARYASDKDPSNQEWLKRLGSNFIHLHHYCSGLLKVNLADKQSDKNEKMSGYTSALGEFNYVIRSVSPDFKLLPRIIYELGQTYEKMGNTPEAMRAYQRCISINPRLPIPYAALSDLFLKQNNKKEALLMLEQGLKFRPNSKSLLKRMDKLNKGK